MALYIINKTKEGGCSCNPLEYKELQDILFHENDSMNMQGLKVLYLQYYNSLAREIYNRSESITKRLKDVGNIISFSTWLEINYGFIKQEYIEFNYD